MPFFVYALAFAVFLLPVVIICSLKLLNYFHLFPHCPGYISGKVKTLDFKIPDIEISRNDTIDVQNKIMSIDPEKRKALKINKSTLWYQQKKIKEGKTIKMYNF